MEYAYSLLNTKQFDDESDVIQIEGVATTPTPDRMNDIVEPKGAKFTIPMPFLWQHQHDAPIGNVSFAKPTKDGIPFKAEIPRVKEPGRLKDRIDEAIQSMKYKLVNAISIGFRPIEYAFMDDGGIHFLEWEWLETSLVTIPMNPEARLELAKGIDRSTLAALGIDRVADRAKLLLPGVTGNQHRRPITLIPRNKT